MSDLISRADAIEALGEEPEIIRDTDVEWEMHDRWVDAVDNINALPSAETTGALDDAIAKYVADGLMELPSADRPSGEWKYLHGSTGSYMTIHCPFCGNTFNDVAEWKYNYCPSCGTKMKGGEDE